MDNPVEILGSVSAFILGASIGSFLNVCIYRWPLGLKVNKPARSFCPGCRRSIPMWQNIPLLSWLLLRGRCAGCKSPISFRYFGVELLTGLVFWGLWEHFPPAQAVALAFFAVSCIVTVFVDFEHYIIPNQVTWGFLPVGLAAAAAVPQLLGQEIWWKGLLASALGAAVGYGVLWLVVELGKRAFGKKTRSFPEPVDWKLHEGPDENPELLLDGKTNLWEDLFNRETDRLIIETNGLTVDGRKSSANVVVVAWDHLVLREEGKEDQKIPLAEVKVLGGLTRRVVVPREAMGMGDVYFLAMAGAFVGWKGVLFTVFAASIYGTVFGLAVMILGRKHWAGRIPFGPWLVAALWTWILVGTPVLEWYLGMLGAGKGTVPAF